MNELAFILTMLVGITAAPVLILFFDHCCRRYQDRIVATTTPPRK